MSYFTWSSALDSSDLLLSHPITLLAPTITTILISTLKRTQTLQQQFNLQAKNITLIPENSDSASADPDPTRDTRELRRRVSELELALRRATREQEKQEVREYMNMFYV